MNTVIAEMTLFAKRSGEEPFEVRVQIGTPYENTEHPNEWICPISMRPLSEAHSAHGADSMQALSLAMCLVASTLQDVRDMGGSLSYDGVGDDFRLDSYRFGYFSNEELKDMSSLSDEEIDALLMAQVKKTQRKVAMVVAMAMREYGNWDEERLGQRVIALVEAGKVEAFGDVRKWRFSEIRLPAQE